MRRSLRLVALYLLAAVAALAVTLAAGLRAGLLFAIGIGFGAALAAVSFGFTTGWRVWIRERDPTGFLAQLLLIGLAMAATIPLRATHPDLAGAAAPLSLSLVLGAFVFGAAMQVADGCGS
ncbi:MAG: YeeE/YedE thiosulfate transporter family protein, partial [Burkholderiaceae bacterium]